MRLKRKIGLAEPRLFIYGMLFLVIIPYFYPQKHFVYKKVFSYEYHILFSIILIALTFTGYVFSRSSLSINIRDNYTFKEFERNQLLIEFSLIVLLLSFLMNLILVIYSLINFSGSFVGNKSLLDDFVGINILSQFYMFFLPIVLYFSLSNKNRINQYFIILFGFILFFRSLLYAERIAFLEFLIPCLIVLSIYKSFKVSISRLIKYFLIFLIFFILLELTRQFYIVYVDTGEEINYSFALNWTVERFFAYYSDTQNKFYYVLDNKLGFTGSNYLNPLSRFTERLFNVRLTGEGFNVREYSFRDFTNPGGLTFLYLDFSYFWFLGYLLLIITFYQLWVRLKNGKILALAIYPHFVVCILELPRFIYLYTTRFVYPLIAFILIFLFTYSLKSFKKELSRI